MVADNASTDDSLEVLRTEFPEIKIVRNDKNYGFAGGYNQALKQVEADNYILLNSDVEVSQGWIEPLIDALQKRGIGAVQPENFKLRGQGTF